MCNTHYLNNYLPPKEFVLYIDHQDLQYFNSQGILNQRNLKWVEFLQSCTLVLQYSSGKSNRVVDALSRRQLLLIEMQIKLVGLKELSTLYPNDPNFGEAWKACTKLVTLDKTKWLDFTIQDSMLFKGSQLCIPRSSMRDNLIKKKHRGGLVVHFGRDKTFVLVVEIYYWPQS